MGQQSGVETHLGKGHPLCPLTGQVDSLSPSVEMPEPDRVTHSKERALLHLATGPSFMAAKAWPDLLVRDLLPTLRKVEISFY